MKNSKDAIYILTNPSFPNYIKIGYASDINEKLKEINDSKCTPFPFKLYAYYEVSHQLNDEKLQELIENYNYEVNATKKDNSEMNPGFYNLSPEKAYNMLLEIDKISRFDNLYKKYSSDEKIKEEKATKENILKSVNKHCFKNIEFTSSLTHHKYKSSTNNEGNLSIYDITTGEEVPNYAHPSKRQIIKFALYDLTGKEEEKELTTYEYMHKLEKVIINGK